MKYFGDSYDFVKQALLRCLIDCDLGPWSALPMFTERVEPSKSSDLESFLGAKLILEAPLQPGDDRSSYFKKALSVGHLFLDPNTGVRKVGGRKAPNYVFPSELISLSSRRPKYLTMVFDQSLSRGTECVDLQDKLRDLSKSGVFGFAYRSHACFLVVSEDKVLIRQAREAILKKYSLPEDRLITVTSDCSRIAAEASA